MSERAKNQLTLQNRNSPSATTIALQSLISKIISAWGALASFNMPLSPFFDPVILSFCCTYFRYVCFQVDPSNPNEPRLGPGGCRAMCTAILATGPGMEGTAAAPYKPFKVILSSKACLPRKFLAFDYPKKLFVIVVRERRIHHSTPFLGLLRLNGHFPTRR